MFGTSDNQTKFSKFYNLGRGCYIPILGLLVIGTASHNLYYYVRKRGTCFSYYVYVELSSANAVAWRCNKELIWRTVYSSLVTCAYHSPPTKYTILVLWCLIGNFTPHLGYVFFFTYLFLESMLSYCNFLCVAEVGFPFVSFLWTDLATHSFFFFFTFFNVFFQFDLLLAW